MYNREEKTVDILINYLKDINKKYWINYLDIEDNDDDDIEAFLNKNVISQDYFNLNIIEEYIKLIKKKLNMDFKIYISFVTENIYWENVFVINETIFIKRNFYKNICKIIENNSYKYINETIIINDNFYNKKFIKILTESINYINYFYNIDNYLKNKFERNILFINKEDIINLKDLSYFKDPNFYFLNNKIPIYCYNNKLYLKLNLFTSKPSFSPYYENNIYELIINNNNYKMIKY